jgi:hypothetical protein
MNRRIALPVASLVAAAAVVVALACGSSSTQDTTSGGPNPPGDDTGGDDGGAGSKDGATKDGSGPSPEGGPTGWDGTFKGPLTCSSPGSPATNWAGQCGTARWTVKTGADSAASSISLLPTLTTVQPLSILPAPGALPFAARVKPVETTVYAFKDARLAFARLEDDSDYHLVLADKTGTTLIGEIPYPKGCTTNSQWQCLISKARAAVDAKLTLALDVGHTENLTVSVVGVGFWDDEHGQFGAAPNAIELHPILAICFGAGCDPTL